MAISLNAEANQLNEKPIEILLGDTEYAPYSETAPGNILSTFNAAVLGQLIETDKNFELTPGHLESWNWDYKKSAYILKIKNGLKFHNGRNITSKDLEFSLLRGFFSNNQSFYRTYLSNVHGVDKIKPGTQFKSGAVEGVSILDELTIAVKLSHPNPNFLLGLTGPYFSFVPLEELNPDYMTWKKTPIGAGPFKVIKEFHNGITKLERCVKNPKKANFVNLHTKALKNQQYDISIFDSSDINFTNHKSSLSELPANILRISFSNVNPIAKKPAFKNFLYHALNKTHIVNGLNDLSETEELLPRHLWGRSGLKSTRDKKIAIKILTEDLPELKKQPIKICLFSGKKIKKSRELIIERICKSLNEFGVEVVHQTSLNKFITIDEAKFCHIFIAGMVSDYIDPLVMFASLTKRSANQFTKANDDEILEKLYLEASNSAQKENRIIALQTLSKYVTEKNIVIPIAEEKTKYFYDTSKVDSLGSQNQPLTLFLDRIEVK